MAGWCETCGGQLTGQRTTFCSRACADRLQDWPTEQQIWNEQTKLIQRGWTEKEFEDRAVGHRPVTWEVPVVSGSV